MELTIAPASFVVDFIILTATGEVTDSINTDVFNKAVELMRESEITDFEDIQSYLEKHEFDASFVFGCPVTQDTHDAFSAYLCYSI